jgi:ribosomal protein S18 acetylase RimI-like enzyme
MIQVRLCTPADNSTFAALMAEVLQHYGMQVPGEQEVRLRVSEELAKVQCLLAFEGDSLVGFASYAFLFPGDGLAPQLYMKDLYTKAAARGRGVARALIRALAREAKASGCVRIDWTAERDNLQAQAAYQALGAAILEEKIYYRLDAQAIARLCEDDG